MSCPICLKTSTNPHTLECKHEFCAACIVKWFRAGHASCPLCRKMEVQPSQLGYLDSMARYHLLRRISRSSKSPKLLRSLIQSLKKNEKSLKSASRMKRMYFCKHRDVINRSKMLSNRIWDLKLKIRRKKKQISYFTGENIQLPSIYRMF